MPPKRASTRKRQTRLAFTPLPSSSPAATKYPSQIQDRAAAVRYSDPSTPSKRRRLTGHLENGATSSPTKSPGTESPTGRVNFAVVVPSPSPSKGTKKASQSSPKLKFPPTPVASSQAELGPQIQDSEVQSSSLESDSETETACQITLNPLSIRKDINAKGVSSQSKLLGMKGIVQAKSALAEDAGATMDSRPRKNESRKEPARSSSEGDDLPIPSGRKRNGAAVAIIVSSEDDSDDNPIRLDNPRRNTTRVDIVDRSSHTPHQSRPIPSLHVNARQFLLGGSTGNAPVSSLRVRNVVTPTKPSKSGTRHGTLPSTQRRTRSSGKAEQTTSPTKRRTRSTIASNKRSTAAPIGLDDESDGEVNPLKPSVRWQGSSTPAMLNTLEGESDDGVPMASDARSTAARTSTKAAEISYDIEGSDEDIVISPKKRSRRKSIGLNGHTPILATEGNMKQHKDDLQEDLEDLQETEVRNDRTRTRGANSKRTAAQKQLELLKRRRAAQKIVELSSESEGDPAPRRGIYDSDSHGGNVSEAQDDISEEDNGSGTECVRQSLRAGLDEYDEDFVDDDDEGALGAPLGLEDIPLEFTRHAHKKPREHFKDAVEWMVHNKLNPAFARDDPVYKIAFYKLDDEVKGYSASKFLSAAWNSRFSKALKARPEFEEIRVPTMFDHKCDACNRSGHPAKYRITFSGKAYHHESLEDISDDEDEEGDEDADDAKSHDSRGNSIPGTEVQYFVGRFCRANAQTAHALTHWRYHLNQWVLDWLKTAGHTEPAKIVDRENWSVKRRGEFANKVVDGMEEKGEIKALYRDFKINLEAAREAKPNRYRDRDDD